MSLSAILRETRKWRSLVWGILDPSSASDGQVLTADGSGGAAYEDPAVPERYVWQYHDTLDVSSGTASPECATDFPAGTIAVRFFAEQLNMVAATQDVLVEVESDVSGYLSTGYNQQATRDNANQNNSTNAFHIRRGNTADKVMGHGEMWLENDDDVWSFKFAGQEHPDDAQANSYLTEGYIDLGGESLINFRFNPNGETWSGLNVYVSVLAPVP